MISSPKSGLGRGLASLIPTAETAEQTDLSPEEQILHNLINSGLDQIESHVRLDLLAYAHIPHHDEPTLVLRRPALDRLTSARAYRLFTRIDRALSSGAAEGSFTVDGGAVVFLRTKGDRSSGVHFIGRAGAVLDRRSLGLARATARSFASITNQYFAGRPDDLPAIRLVIEIDGPQTGVEAIITHTDQPEQRGRVAANDASEAVARAVLEASGAELSFRECREMPINGTKAVLVVFSDARGVPHPGFVLSDDDTLQATATAALRAILGR